MLQGNLYEMIDLTSQVYDLTEKGKCTGCGNCCSNSIPLSKSEITEISRYIKANNIQEEKSFFLNATIDQTCPFMSKSDTNKKCKIYDVRPMICKYFKCNEPSSVLQHHDIYKEERKIVNMRTTFYK